MAWLFCASQALADEIIIGDVTVSPGGTASLVIGYRFTSTVDKVGFTLALSLPEGISLLKDEDGDPVYVKDASISKFNPAFAGDGKIAFQPQNESATIRGMEGTLLTLTLIADNSLAVGSAHLVNVTKATFQQRVDGHVTDVYLDDFSFTVTIGAPDDGRIHFDETSSVLPEYTAGEKGDVTVERTIRTGLWNTLVLPFNLTKATATSLFGSDVQFAQFSGFDVDYGDDEDNITPLGITLRFSSYTIPARGNLPGGTPILIKVNTPQDITKIEADNVTLASLVTDVNTMDEYGTAGRFTATMVKRVVPADGLFITDNQFWYSTGKTNIKAFRGWFELGAVVGKETDFSAKVRFVIDDVPTAIEGMGADVQEGPVYTLQGMLVGENVDWDTLPRGIYIVNGKKLFKN